jgi:hypothetical protein
MAGYSGTPLPRKLGITPGSRVALLHAPDGLAAQLDPLPSDVSLRRDARSPADVILLFATDAAALPEALAIAMRALVASGGLWIAWLKRVSRTPYGLSENEVRAIGLAAGLVDNKVCAIDDTWSGLRFVVRLADRPTWPVR